MLDALFLDTLWDFDDPHGSEERLRAVLDSPETPGGERPELATQVARALGLQEKFDEAGSLLESVDEGAYGDPDAGPAIRVRTLLERGRLRNSAGHTDAAVPLFEAAAGRAHEAGLDFLEVDALHMLAIADLPRAGLWTERGLAAVDGASGTAAERARIQRWRVSLSNNMGWAFHDAGDFESALAQFQQAARAAAEVGTPAQQFQARWSVARALRSLQAYDEALDIQEQLAAEDPAAPHVQAELRELARARGL